MNRNRNILYDHYGRIEPSPIILASPGKIPLCVLNSVDETSVRVTKRSNNAHDITFDLYKYVDGELSNGYLWAEEQMEIYCDGIWFCINTPPEVEYDSYIERKTITAESDDCKLSQYMLLDFVINQGTDNSYEMMYQKKHDQDKFYQVKFCDEKNPDLSLLHLVLYHANVPGWKIGYVDNLTPNEDDGITFLPDEICNFEVEEKDVYSFFTQDVSKAYKCVFEFDTQNMLINVYRGESLGKDTNVFLDFHNVQNSLTISRENAMVTVFNVKGDDRVNIDYVNPVGGSLIEDFSFFCREPYMSKSLIEKYKAWVALRDSYIPEYIELSKKYNKNLEVLSEIQYRVPTDSVINDWYSASVEDLKTAYNDNQAIAKGLEALYVDEKGNFDLAALQKSSDWPLYESIRNYTIPTIVAALQSKDSSPDGTTDYGLGNLLKNSNPVTLGATWGTIGFDASTFSCISLEEQPDFGITSGIKAAITSGDCGIEQTDIQTNIGSTYCLSVYVKTTGITNINLLFGTANEPEKRVSQSFEVAPDSWQRIYYAFRAETRLSEIAYTATGPGEVIFAGMQLELGDSPTLYAYYTLDDQELKAYETDWKLYGIEELEIKLATYENSINTLKENGYNVPYSALSKYDKDYHTQMYQKYNDYIHLRDECAQALEERKAEYEAAKLENIQARRVEINTLLQKENFGTSQSEYEGFTDEELFVLNSLRNEATYTNENILVTSIDSLEDEVDIQKRLYDDAMEQLYVESHPQYIYSDTIDNILALPEFKEYHGYLDINNFIRVGIDDEDTYVKLRVTELSYNPCTHDNDMTILFSNMVTYRSKRSDIGQLLDLSSERTSSRSQIVSSGSTNSTTQYTFTTEAIKKLFSNPYFQSQLSGTTVGGAGSGGNGGTAVGTITAEKIITELIKADEGIFENLTADTAFIKYLSTTMITSEKIVAEILSADEAKIKELQTTIVDASQLSADVADITKLLAGNAGVGNLQTINLTAENVTIDDAVIKNLIAAQISVADLMTHSATAELITLISSDGKPSIAFQNSTQQFYDSAGNVRVQIGQDGNGDFNFIVRGTDGTTALFDSNGIRQEGIPDGTIINNMILNGTIEKEKLGFQIVEANEQGGIDITQIYDGNGNNWGIQYDSFKTQTNTDISGLKDLIKKIELLGEQIFTKSGENISPDFINLAARCTGGVAVSKWLVNGVEDTLHASSDKTYFTATADMFGEKNSILIRAEDSTGNYYDEMTLYLLIDGSSNITVVISSSEGEIFKSDTSVTKTQLTRVVYQGAQEITPNWTKWYQKTENSNWVLVANTDSISVTLSNLGAKRNYRCDVDV